MATPETAVKNAVKKRLEHYGVYPFQRAADMPADQVNGVYWPAVAGPMSVHGIHDFCLNWFGIFCSIECKAPNNPEDATEPQRAFFTANTKAGGISLIGVRDASAVDRLHELIQERTGRDSLPHHLHQR